MAERSSCDVHILSIPVPIRRGGSESNLDVVDSVGDDGVGLDFTKGALGIDSLQQKILKVTEQIKVEQTARDQHVAEYLKLVNNADKQQVVRIRQVFEKKNQKSAHTIARLQRKLEQYHRRMKDSETNGKHSHKDGSSKESGTHSKEGSLKDVSTTGRHPALDKVKTIGPGVSLSPPFFFNKSREFANLIRNKFGSADNIAHLKSSMETGSGLQVEGGARGLSGSANTVAKTTKYQSDDECSTGTSASADSNGNPAGGSGAGSGGPGRSDSNGRLGEVLEMVREIREAQTQLAEEMETLNTQFKRDYSYFTQMMQEERYRYERLEDQLNDLTELHQHETSNLKQELASIEEKVAYQAYERARDIQETGQELHHQSETPVSDKRYEWQLFVGQQWLPIANDHVIETHYCQPGAKGITINTSHGQVFIDFDTLQTQNAGMKVQRLTFLPVGEAEDVGWYFKDDQLWCEYGTQSSNMSTSSISSRDAERRFTINPQGSFTFTVGSTSYTLDFSTMSQTNSSTGLRRNVRRRPKFPSSTDSLHATSSAQPTNGGHKWEFMGDEGQWTEYQAHICSFDSAAIETQYQTNPRGQLQFRVKRFSYTLDFSKMHQVNDNIGTIRAVRRTAYNLSQQQNSSGTQPRWQFQDIDGSWKEYSKGYHQCSVSSQDIELQYQQNPSGTIRFTAKNFSYELNFTAMTQRNMSTNTTRSVRRLNQ